MNDGSSAIEEKINIEVIPTVVNSTEENNAVENASADEQTTEGNNEKVEEGETV